MVLNQGDCTPPGDIWQWLETVLIIRTGGGLLLTSSGWRAWMLLRAALWAEDGLPQQRIAWPQTLLEGVHLRVSSVLLGFFFAAALIYVKWKKCQTLKEFGGQILQPLRKCSFGQLSRDQIIPVRPSPRCSYLALSYNPVLSGLSPAVEQPKKLSAL